MKTKFLILVVLSINLFPSTPCQFAPEFQRQRMKNNFDRFVAAGKNDPPPCNIRPGETFCEKVKFYPYETILEAIKTSKYDVKRLLIDESLEDSPDFGFVNAASEMVTDRFLPDNRFLRRFARDGRSISETFSNETIFETEKANLSRSSTLNEALLHSHTKRQSANMIAMPSCRYRVRYIYPQALMCASTGEWMYVVNLREFGAKKLSQMIRTEVCDNGVVGQPCMGDCTDPNRPLGTASVCEQHYLQKRLMAISPNDRKIVSEMFWVPTCCICKTFRLL